MTTGIIVNGVDLTTAFDCIITNRSIGSPVKQNNLVYVPYRDGPIDYSDYYGEPTFSDRSIEYEIVVSDQDPETVRSTAHAVEEWLYAISNAEIKDGLDPDWHFLGSCTSVDTDWSSGVRVAKIKATFTCHPFRIADRETSQTLSAGENEVVNAGRRARISASTDGSTTLTIGNLSQSFSGDVLLDLSLASGANVVVVEGSSCTIRWKEERI